MATRVIAGRPASGKKGRLPRGGKTRGKEKLRRAGLSRLPGKPAARAAGLRKIKPPRAGNPPAAETEPRSALSHLPERWAEPSESRHAPEERELRRKRAQLGVLESELARQEHLLAGLQGELAPFESRYYRKVGTRCARLDEIEARIAETYANLHPDDMAARQAAGRARQRARRSRDELQRRNPASRFDPPPALKRLYRAVARRVHPDLGQSPADRQVRERLMAHANKAFASGDERRLRSIVSEYEFCPETVRGEGTPVELVRVIRKMAQVKTRCEEVHAETERVRSSELFRFKRVFESQARRGRDLFAEATAAVNARIADALRKLERLEAASGAGR